MTIARTWSGATRATDADEYLGYLHRTGLKEYMDTPGNEAVLCLRRIDGDEAEFTIVTLWRDEGAVRAFAGPDPHRAVFYPEDDRFLVRRQDTVDHYEVVFVRHPGAPPREGWFERFVGWWTRWARAAIPAPEDGGRHRDGA